MSSTPTRSSPAKLPKPASASTPASTPASAPTSKPLTGSKLKAAKFLERVKAEQAAGRRTRSARPPAESPAPPDPTAPITQLLGIPPPRRFKGAKSLNDSRATATHTRAEVSAQSPARSKSKRAKAAARDLEQAGIIPPITTPEILPAVPGHPALESRNGGLGKGTGTAMVFSREARRVRALELRRQGLSIRAICDELTAEGFNRTDGKPLSVKTIFYDLQECLVYLARLQPAIAEQVRNLELYRLDHMQQALDRFVGQGDTYAIMASLAIMKHRADLLGLKMTANNVDPKDNKQFTRPLENLTDTELRQRVADRAKALGVALPEEFMDSPPPGEIGGPPDTTNGAIDAKDAKGDE